MGGNGNSAGGVGSEGIVGIVGLGLVGRALGQRLRARDIAVIGYDVDPAKVVVGGIVAKSIAELAGQATTIIVAVFDTDQLETVVLGAGGITAPARGARSIINVATADPDRVAALATQLQGRGIDLIEAPLVGSSTQIREGEALMLVGGDAHVIDKHRCLLDILAPRWHSVGAAGMAARAKLAMNLVLGLNRAALAEGLVLAEHMGLDPRAFVALLRDSAAYSRVIDTKAERMLTAQFQPEARLAQHCKDVRLMLDQAAKSHPSHPVNSQSTQPHAAKSAQRLPLSEAHHALLETAITAGLGDLDNAAVIEAIRATRPVTS